MLSKRIFSRPSPAKEPRLRAIDDQGCGATDMDGWRQVNAALQHALSTSLNALDDSLPLFCNDMVAL
eukprot:2732428-Rhodomonas_salina.1